MLLRGKEAASKELGVLVLTPLAVIALKTNPVGHPRGSGGSRALQESVPGERGEKKSHGAPLPSGSVQRDSLKLYL